MQHLLKVQQPVSPVYAGLDGAGMMSKGQGIAQVTDQVVSYIPHTTALCLPTPYHFIPPSSPILSRLSNPQWPR
jgi:hypothetical protein